MLAVFVPFLVNTDVLSSFPSLHYKKRKKKSVPDGDTLSQRKLFLAALCLPAGGTWSRIRPLLNSAFDFHQAKEYGYWKMQGCRDAAAGKEMAAFGSIRVTCTVRSKRSGGGGWVMHTLPSLLNRYARVFWSHGQGEFWHEKPDTSISWCSFCPLAWL